MTRLVAAIAIAAACGSCTVDRRSSGLACDSQGMCPDGRVCDRGYCVLFGGAPPDARQSVCPPGCMCNFATSTCTIYGTGGQSVTCPIGWNCAINCVGDGTCGDITCTMGASCIVMCVGGAACGNITCGPGQCNAMCTGSGACGLVDCSSSCQCDVECATGDCQQISCPMTHPGQYCTPTGSDGPPCDSSFSGMCRSC